MSAMHLETKPDLEQCLRRMEAFWEQQVLDRPFVQVTAPKPNPQPYPQARHASLRDRWLDAAHSVDWGLFVARNTYWGGDAIPTYFPILGP